MTSTYIPPIGRNLFQSNSVASLRRLGSSWSGGNRLTRQKELSEVGNEPRQLGEIGNRAIVIRSRDEVENACRRVRSGGGHLVPLLDTSGMKLSGVDEAVATEAYPEAALSIIHEFEKRRARLAVWIRESSRPEVRLLAFMYVHGRELTARYDPGSSKGAGPFCRKGKWISWRNDFARPDTFMRPTSTASTRAAAAAPRD